MNGVKIGKAEKYIRDKLDKDGAILLSLIDPDKHSFEKGAKIAQASAEAGADVILVGGSIGAQGIVLDKTVKMIREKVNIPIILFPGNVGTITPYADATYFMYLMNSREVYWMSTVQIQGAPIIKRMGIEPIPTGYIIVEPGKAVGWISNANPVPRDRGDLAGATALAAQYMGARLIVTDAGSGAEQPATLKFVSTVKRMIDIPYIYGGGVRTPKQAADIIEAGADGIQIGTAFEIDGDYKTIKTKISKMVKAIKAAGAKKKKARDGKFITQTKKILPMLRIPGFDRSKLLKRWKTHQKSKQKRK
jgi:phosphoglycerol geranylgeranyltransferase